MKISGETICQSCPLCTFYFNFCMVQWFLFMAMVYTYNIYTYNVVLDKANIAAREKYWCPCIAWLVATYIEGQSTDDPIQVRWPYGGKLGPSEDFDDGGWENCLFGH